MDIPATSDLTVSIIMPAYNAERFLERAVHSVLAQTCNDWRLIIIDDGSTDSTLELAQTFAAADARITVLHQENAGQANATNAGIAAAQTEWVACVDADDELDHRWAASLQKAAREHPGYALYGSNLLVLSKAHPEGTSCFPEEGTPEILNLVAFLTQQNFSNNGAWMRRDLWQQAGGFRNDSYSEDYDLIVRILLIGNGLRIPESLYIYHTEHEGRKSDLAILQSIAVIEICTELLTKHDAELDGARLHATCQQLVKRVQTVDHNDPRSAAALEAERTKEQARQATADQIRHASRFSARLRRSFYHLAAAIIGEGRAERLKKD